MNLAYKAFSMTGAYDAMISRYFADQVGDQFPDTLKSLIKESRTFYVMAKTLNKQQINMKIVMFKNLY